MQTRAQGTALITGASTGIGARSADRLARRGYALLLVARHRAWLETLATRLTDDTDRSIEVIAVPTSTLAGDSDGVAPASDGTCSATQCSGTRTHRIIQGSGHHRPHEAPQASAEAIVDVDGY